LELSYFSHIFAKELKLFIYRKIIANLWFNLISKVYMRKFTLLVVTYLIIVSYAFAAPAKKGIRKQVMLPNGSNVFLELKGDENFHYWEDSSGQAYLIGADDVAMPLKDVASLKAKAMKMRRIRTDIPFL
jgi:hypothetical protein